MKALDLSIDILKLEAKNFCQILASENHSELRGVTDGKAVGTYVEHKFKQFLAEKYDFTQGNSASGIDLPDKAINTDIKITSITQPQSSCPFKSARQKVFGLGYNLLVFVYEKIDSAECRLKIHHCAFINADRTADWSATTRLLELKKDGAGKEDITAYLRDRNMPLDEIGLGNLADEILQKDFKQGVLTISNALQWRLQYGRAVSLANSVEGVENYDF